MILPLFVSLLIALACGALLVLTLAPALRASRAGLAFALLLGAGLGLGLLSCLHFLALIAGAAPWLPLIDLSALALTGGIGLVFWKGRRGGKGNPPAAPGEPWSRWQIALAGILSLQGLAAAASFWLTFFQVPHGRWDAWLIWNMHARFLYRAGEHWRAAFASGQDWSHWDYPLLLPLAIARGWIYQGGEILLAPALIAFVFCALTVGALAAGLMLLRGRTEGFLAAMILTATPFFLYIGVAQFADIPLAFFFLTALLLLAAQARFPESRGGMLILAGLAAGLAAWTKNEGLLFALAATAGLCGATLLHAGGRAALGRTALFLAGAAPVLLIVLFFKVTVAPANDILAGVGQTPLLDKLLDPGRYGEIFRAFGLTALSFTQGRIDIGEGLSLNLGPVSLLLPAAYLLLAGLKRPGRDRDGLTGVAVTVGLMLVGYFTIYLITSQDLRWHLFTSLNRLYLQLWPATLLLFFLVAGPEKRPVAAEAAQTALPPPEARSPQGKKQKRHPKFTIDSAGFLF